MKWAQDKFLMLAEKIWVPSELIEKIKENFANADEVSMEVEVTKDQPKKEDSSPVEVKKDEPKEDQSKEDDYSSVVVVEKQAPTEDEIDNMSEDELKMYMKKMVKDKSEKKDKWSSIAEMMKKRGF